MNKVLTYHKKNLPKTGYYAFLFVLSVLFLSERTARSQTEADSVNKGSRIIVYDKSFTAISYDSLLESVSFDSLLEMPLEKVTKIAKVVGVPIDELFTMVVSTAGKEKQKVSAIPASVIVVTHEDIEKFGYTCVEEILENVPGLYPIDNLSFYGPSFGVRGSWADQENSDLVILVDGVKQTFEFFGSNPLTKIPIPVAAIERIEIIRGPMSLMYGSGAFFGAINIITNQKGETKSTRQVSATIGSRKTREVYLGIKECKRSQGFIVNASYTGTYGLSVPLSRMTSKDYSPYGFTSTNGRLEEQTKYFSLNGFHKEFSAAFTYVESAHEGYLFAPSGNEGSTSEMRSVSMNLEYDKTLSDRFRLEGRFRYQRDWVHNDLDRPMRIKYDTSYVRLTDAFEFDQFESNAIEAEINTFIKPVHSVTVTSGISYRGVTELKYRNDHPVYMLPIYYNAVWYLDNAEGITSLSPYLQVQYVPYENLRFIGGVRLQYMPDISYTIRYSFDTTAFSPGYFSNHYLYYHYSPRKFALVPQLAVIYSINDYNVLKFLYGKAFKNPSFESVTDATTRGFDVGPEYIHTLELNYSSRPVRSVGIGISAFGNILENLIIRKNIYDKKEDEYYSVLDNGANRITIGTELSVSWSPGRNLTLQLAGTIQKTRNREKAADTLDIPYSPKTLGYLKLDYSPFKKITLSATATWVDRMYTEWNPLKFNSDSTWGGFFGRVSPAYFNTGVVLRWDNIANSHLYGSIRLNNLFNTVQYYPATNFSSWANKGTLRYGRSLFITIGYVF